MTNDSELNILITGCKNKDRKSQKRLYELYNKRLFILCNRYCKNEAEDVLQAAFIKIFNNIEKYEGSGSFEGWIKKITLNTAISAFHKRNILKNSNDIVDYEEFSLDDKHADVVSQMSAENILELINSLPDIYRVTFNLYAIEGYKHNEIAEMLQISEGTSKSQLSRARKMLQEKLEHTTLKEKNIKYA